LGRAIAYGKYEKKKGFTQRRREEGKKGRREDAEGCDLLRKLSPASKVE
jgi:hypothetical protein